MTTVCLRAIRSSELSSDYKSPTTMEATGFFPVGRGGCFIAESGFSRGVFVL